MGALLVSLLLVCWFADFYLACYIQQCHIEPIVNFISIIKCYRSVVLMHETAVVLV